MRFIGAFIVACFAALVGFTAVTLITSPAGLPRNCLGVGLAVAMVAFVYGLGVSIGKDKDE